MAKKKQQRGKRTGKETSQRRSTGKPTDEFAPVDRRIIESTLRDLVSAIESGAIAPEDMGALSPKQVHALRRRSDTPESRAQDLLEQAYEAPPVEQVRLVQEALAVQPDCGCLLPVSREC